MTVVGCGDAFGSGGRLQTCYHVETAATRFLIDCGASALIGFNRTGLEPNAVATIEKKFPRIDEIQHLIDFVRKSERGISK